MKLWWSLKNVIRFDAKNMKYRVQMNSIPMRGGDRDNPSHTLAAGHTVPYRLQLKNRGCASVAYTRAYCVRNAEPCVFHDCSTSSADRRAIGLRNLPGRNQQRSRPPVKAKIGLQITYNGSADPAVEQQQRASEPGVLTARHRCSWRFVRLNTRRTADTRGLAGLLLSILDLPLRLTSVVAAVSIYYRYQRQLISNDGREISWLLALQCYSTSIKPWQCVWQRICQCQKTICMLIWQWHDTRCLTLQGTKRSLRMRRRKYAPNWKV